MNKGRKFINEFFAMSAVIAFLLFGISLLFQGVVSFIAWEWSFAVDPFFIRATLAASFFIGAFSAYHESKGDQ